IARLRVALVAGKAAFHIGRRLARQQRDAVIAALAERLDVIAEAFELERREILGEAFDFLQADDIGLRVLQPGQQMRQPRFDRVHVPRSDFHSTSLKLGHYCDHRKAHALGRSRASIAYYLKAVASATRAARAKGGR